jgi:uncharacterized delta-60 repeat protein
MKRFCGHFQRGLIAAVSVCLLDGATAQNAVTLDPRFSATVEVAPGSPSPSVGTVAPLADGKVLLSGAFSLVNSQLVTNIARLNADGSLDSDFKASVGHAGALSLTVQRDGGILVAGLFPTVCGLPYTNLARLNPDGTLDTTFNPAVNSWVNIVAVQPDGKIVIGGTFSSVGGQPCTNLARLNTDGTLDAAFHAWADSWPYTVALQPDGKILLGGYFTQVNGQGRHYFARLNPDGALDTGFNADVEGSEPLLSIALQADNKILIAGQFGSVRGVSRNSLARLNGDGTVDTSFNPGANGWVGSIGAQTDGKIIVAGQFSIVAGQPRTNLARLNANGTLDSSFVANCSDPVATYALEPNGKILVAGQYSTINGQTCGVVVQLINTEAAAQTLIYDGATITWLRGGTSPEVWRTTFESSSDGTSGSMLGAGSRVSGGWQLTGVSLPPGSFIRARGDISGDMVGTHSFVESLWPSTAPAVTSGGYSGTPPARFSLNVSGSAGSAVVVEASPDLRTWTPLVTNVLPSGPWPFSDYSVTNFPSRFYRGRLMH